MTDPVVEALLRVGYVKLVDDQVWSQGVFCGDGWRFFTRGRQDGATDVEERCGVAGQISYAGVSHYAVCAINVSVLHLPAPVRWAVVRFGRFTFSVGRNEDSSQIFLGAVDDYDVGFALRHGPVMVGPDDDVFARLRVGRILGWLLRPWLHRGATYVYLDGLRCYRVEAVQ